VSFPRFVVRHLDGEETEKRRNELVHFGIGELNKVRTGASQKIL
jgi:hypothetical protein